MTKVEDKTISRICRKQKKKQRRAAKSHISIT